jgi:hypothetical protein
LSGIFPYYLMPSGLAVFWGFLPIGGALPPDPWLSAGIVVGGLLLAAAAAAAVWLTWRGHAAATCTLVMFLTAGWLLAQPDGFGLFKLAMFLQPFLLATVAAVCWQSLRRRWVAVGALTALGLAGVATQGYYREASRGAGTAFLEIADPSRSQLTAQLEQLGRGVAGKRVLADFSNESLTKLLAAHLLGTELAFPCNHRLNDVAGLPSRKTPNPALAAASQRLHDNVLARWPKLDFDLQDPQASASRMAFHVNLIGCPAMRDGSVDLLLRGCYRTTVLNRWHQQPDDERHFELVPWDGVHNHLLLVPAEDWNEASLGHLEPDLLYPGRTMAGCGRQLLFEILKPAPQVRVRLDLTASYKGDAANCLPAASVIGAKRVALPLTGRGAARVLSAPLAPQWIAGHAFLALDCGALARTFPEKKRQGLMALYGSQFGGDIRRLVAFVRDISLVTEEEYAALRPPAQLEHFPQDLLHPDLEYAGLYEDGWLSEASWFRLTRPEGATKLLIRSTVPALNDPGFKTEATVLLDGKEVDRRELGLARFEIEVPVPAGMGQARVELRFSRWQQLPQGDGRPVAALLSFVGFAGEPPTAVPVRK